MITLSSRCHSGYTQTLLVAYGDMSGEGYFYQHYDVFDDHKPLRFMPQRYVDARRIRRTMAPDWGWHHVRGAVGCRKILEAGGHV